MAPAFTSSFIKKRFSMTVPKSYCKEPVVLSRYTLKDCINYEDPNYVYYRKNRPAPNHTKYAHVESHIPGAAKENELNTCRKMDSDELIQSVKHMNIESPKDIKLGSRTYVHGYSRRFGMVGVKLGMLSYFDGITGKKHPVTVVWFDRVQALWSHPTSSLEKNDKMRIDLAGGSKNERNIKPYLKKYFKNCSVPGKRHLVGFSVTKDALVPPGIPETWIDDLFGVIFRDTDFCGPFHSRTIR